MLVPIANTPRPYAWGSHTAIAELFGRPPSGAPEAEVWFGAHPGSPSRIVDTTLSGGAASLDAWIRRDPAAALGPAWRPGSEPALEAPRLPFLLKVLAAERPLSLQVHPSAAQARAGHARDDEAGLAPDDPARDYRDPYPKPEMIVAVSRFDALCGFRPLDACRRLVRQLSEVGGLGADRRAALAALAARLAPPAVDVAPGGQATPVGRALAGAVEWILAGSAGPALVEAVVAQARRIADGVDADRDAELQAAARLTLDLAEYHPGDPGIVLSLLLNRVCLQPGEALFLPAGRIHAYLHGLGIELMVSSDNVLRGGLTHKHVNVPELVRVLDATPRPARPFTAAATGPGVWEYRPDATFRLARLRAGAGVSPAFPLPGAPAVLLCLSGEVVAFGTAGGGAPGAGEGRAWPLTPGQGLYVTPDETVLRLAGTGEAVLATTALPTGGDPLDAAPQ
ncbi:MAG TPA: mannose-6-phosphate isomerase, class I [Microbacteriaceae bacterium]|nr:mannose-6-phosphate isomerase, class I [Microbacteriaceae bacterium]